MGRKKEFPSTDYWKESVEVFEKASRITKVVADFLAIVERADASFILVEMDIRATEVDRGGTLPPAPQCDVQEVERAV